MDRKHWVLPVNIGQKRVTSQHEDWSGTFMYVSSAVSIAINVKKQLKTFKINNADVFSFWLFRRVSDISSDKEDWKMVCPVSQLSH